MSDLFKAPDQEITIDPEKDYLPDLVGEGKKFKTPADLARAKLESDAFIERLKRENAEMRSKVETELSMKQFLDNLDAKLKAKPADDTTQRTTPDEPNAEQINKGISEEDILKLLDNREKTKQQQENLNKAIELSKKSFGANYSLVLEQKAQELGISKNFLEDIAKSNVSAFARIVGAEPKNDSTQLFPTSSVTTQTAPPVNTGKKYSDFEKMRKENYKEWISPRVQNEIHDLAVKHGEAFLTS